MMISGAVIASLIRGPLSPIKITCSMPDAASTSPGSGACSGDRFAGDLDGSHRVRCLMQLLGWPPKRLWKCV